MPNEPRLNGLTNEVQRLKELLDQISELLHDVNSRVAGLEEELKRARWAKMHEAKEA